MARLTGMLVLSKIPKNLIVKNKKGESCIWVNVDENYRGPDQFGQTHTITMYDKENQRAIYLANLKPQEREKKEPEAKPEVKVGEGDDLPF